jgi:hypothetical protein
MPTKRKSMHKWTKRGAIVGGLAGVLGTLVTYVTGDISFISIPVVLLFSLFGMGLLFISPYFEFFSLVIVYGLVGAIIGYLMSGGR